MYNCINFFVMVVVFARQGWLCYIVVSLSVVVLQDLGTDEQLFQDISIPKWLFFTSISRSLFFNTGEQQRLTESHCVWHNNLNLIELSQTKWNNWVWLSSARQMGTNDKLKPPAW